MATAKPRRADHAGKDRTVYEKNKKRLFHYSDTCALCGKPIDKTLKYPHPMSFTADHIIPISKGGHPSSIENLQPAHLQCNKIKSDKLFLNNERKIKESNKEKEYVVNRLEEIKKGKAHGLRWSIEWELYDGTNFDELWDKMQDSLAKGWQRCAEGYIEYNVEQLQGK